MKSLSFFFFLLKTSIRASISNRNAFLIEASLMIGNNMIFMLLWWIFFRQFKEIGNWTLSDMIALNTIGIGAYGIMQICFGGVRQISKIILSGDLDPFMTQPKNLLIHLAGSKSFAKGWGHLMTSALLLFLGKLFAFKTIVLIIIGMFSGSLVFTAVGIVAHSLVFWLGPVENVSKKYCDSLYLLALYPTNIYSGVMQLVMFTVIPAGIISYLPVELVRNFSWSYLLFMIGSSSALFWIAYRIFYLGLKRYESGNQFGSRI